MLDSKVKYFPCPCMLGYKASWLILQFQSHTQACRRREFYKLSKFSVKGVLISFTSLYNDEAPKLQIEVCQTYAMKPLFQLASNFQTGLTRISTARGFHQIVSTHKRPFY